MRSGGGFCFPDPSKEIIDTNETLEIGACLLSAPHCVLVLENAAGDVVNLSVKLHTQGMAHRAWFPLPDST